MADDPQQVTQPTQPMVVEIRIEGYLDGHWTDWFGGLTITPVENGDTLLTGPIIDQAALFGLLRRVRDLGMQLISVIYATLDRGRSHRRSAAICLADARLSTGSRLVGSQGRL